ncbi:uncharacterized protein ACRADG_002632 [Cochliomyia hominivorax]
MFLIQIIKLLLLMAFLESEYIQVICEINHAQDVDVKKTADKWTCDYIECPLDADRCVVKKTNKDDITTLVRINVCFSKNDEILVEKVTTSKTDDDHLIDMVMVSYSNGVIEIDGAGSFDEQGFDLEIEDEIGE